LTGIFLEEATPNFSQSTPPGLSVTGLEANKINQTRHPSQHTDVTLHYELMPHWKSPNVIDSSKTGILGLSRVSML